MRGWLSNLLSLLGVFRIVSTLYKWPTQRSVRVQRALLVNGFQDMCSPAHKRDEGKKFLAPIVKDAQSITNACVRDAKMQSPATFLSNFATTVRVSDAIAQAALLAAPMKLVAVGTAIMHRIPSRGALHVKRLGLARNAEAVRVTNRSHLQEQFATIAW